MKKKESILVGVLKDFRSLLLEGLSFVITFVLFGVFIITFENKINKTLLIVIGSLIVVFGFLFSLWVIRRVFGLERYDPGHGLFAGSFGSTQIEFYKEKTSKKRS